jgi:hypothetical protein
MPSRFPQSAIAAFPMQAYGPNQISIRISNNAYRIPLPEVFTSTLNMLHSTFCVSLSNFHASCRKVRHKGSNARNQGSSPPG